MKFPTLMVFYFVSGLVGYIKNLQKLTIQCKRLVVIWS